MDYQALAEEVLSDVQAYRGQGKVASYIPALAQADPRKFGIALALEDGTTYVAGDGDEPFSTQSISYVFSLALALHHVKAALWNYVGREPAGSPVNSIVQLEMEKGKPRNPLTAAGAMVVCDQLIGRRGADAAVDELIAFLNERCGECGVAIDETIAMSCRQLARAALVLAFDGNDPPTGEEVCTLSRARRINALMLTCGHYDNSGDFAFRVGLPGKSSVSGGILAIVPRTGAVCVWSPGLNEAGTSLVGAMALERLAERTGWSIFV